MEPLLKKLKPLVEEETNITYIGNEWIDSFFQLPRENRLKILSKLLLPELLDFHTIAALGSESDNRWIQMFENVNLWKYVYAEYFPHSQFKNELPIFLKTVKEGLVTREYLTIVRKRFFTILTPYHGVPSLKPKYGRETPEQEDRYNELMKWRSFVIFCHRNALQEAKRLYILKESRGEQDQVSVLKDVSYQNIKGLITFVAKSKARVVLDSIILHELLTPEAKNILLTVIDKASNANNLVDYKQTLKQMDKENKENWRQGKFVNIVELLTRFRGDFILLSTNSSIYSQLLVSRFVESNSVNPYARNVSGNYRALLIQQTADQDTRDVVDTDYTSVKKSAQHFYLLEKIFNHVVQKVLYGFLRPHPTDEDRRIISIGKENRCGWCHQPNAQLVCSQCTSVAYCGTECQSQDWSHFHAHECGESVIGAQSRYLWIRSKVERKIKWYAEVKRVSPPHVWLAQQHTIAMVEQDVKKLVANAWMWSLAWPEIQIPAGGVTVVGKQKTQFQRGKEVSNAGFTETVRANTMRSRDIWYQLMVDHVEKKVDVPITNGKVKRFFLAIAPLTAKGQKHAELAGQAWETHTRLEQQTGKKLQALKAAREMGQHLDDMFL